MKYFSLSIINIFLSLLFQQTTAQQTAFDSGSVISDHAVPRLISRQFTFTEGPAADKDGNIFFTDQPKNMIWEYSSEGKLSLFMRNSKRANGLFIDREGNIIACADEYNQLLSISREKKINILLNDYMGHKLNGPNDLWIDRRGGIYFTDPYYQRPYWKRTHPDIKEQNVYYLPKGKNQAVIVASDFVKPNGIVGTPDGKSLYVADIEADKTYRYDIMNDGKLINKKLFVAKGSDGMVLDDRGNLYISGNGITVYDSTGRNISFIPINEKWVGNLCFGGKQKNQLFITASEAIYVLPMLAKGVE